MNNDKLVNVLKTLKQDLQSAYGSFSTANKDKNIKMAQGKVDVLIELLSND